ncbi:thioredoxin family protein [Lutibacter sp.]|uniref:thioredoxin family protein n=1 Tax=Lutibacter sp. TaxID=1925666 RepID=UPI0027341FCF|nr:thioredoxin family protein [Lutibacter sp.]MDP3313416.1 thioredoxin family protein [Lutibacter sp.]
MKTPIKSFLFISIVSLVGFGLNPENNGYKIGDIATDFSLKNTDSKMISLANYESAKGFIIIFTCNSCPYSIAYEDRIIALDKKYKLKGYPVIAINPNNPEISKRDNFISMQTRAKEKGFTFPYLLDEGQKIHPQYGATRTPHVFVLNKENSKLIVSYIGAIDNNYSDASAANIKYVEDAINDLLKGKSPKTTITKAIGCSIKY